MSLCCKRRTDEQPSAEAQTLLETEAHSQQLMSETELIAELFCCFSQEEMHIDDVHMKHVPRFHLEFPSGLDLLAHLFRVLRQSTRDTAPLLRQIVSESATPFVESILRWCFQAVALPAGLVREGEDRGRQKGRGKAYAWLRSHSQALYGNSDFAEPLLWSGRQLSIIRVASDHGRNFASLVAQVEHERQRALMGFISFHQPNALHFKRSHLGKIRCANSALHKALSSMNSQLQSSLEMERHVEHKRLSIGEAWNTHDTPSADASSSVQQRSFGNENSSQCEGDGSNFVLSEGSWDHLTKGNASQQILEDDPRKKGIASSSESTKSKGNAIIELSQEQLSPVQRGHQLQASLWDYWSTKDSGRCEGVPRTQQEKDAPLDIAIDENVGSAVKIADSCIGYACSVIVLEELNMRSHLEAIQQYILFGHREFAHELQNGIRAAVFSNSSSSVLNLQLRAALQTALGSQTVPQLSIRAPNAAGVHDVVLSYTVPWPLSFILDESVMLIFEGAFSFFNLMDHASWALCNAWRIMMDEVTPKGLAKLRMVRLLTSISCSCNFSHLLMQCIGIGFILLCRY